MRRAVEIKFMDGTSRVLELGKATSLKTDLGMIHLERMPDDKWRLLWSEDIVDEFSKIKSFEMIRED